MALRMRITGENWIDLWPISSFTFPREKLNEYRSNEALYVPEISSKSRSSFCSFVNTFYLICTRSCIFVSHISWQTWYWVIWQKQERNFTMNTIQVENSSECNHTYVHIHIRYFYRRIWLYIHLLTFLWCDIEDSSCVKRKLNSFERVWV